jgi:5-methylcytosine-specific restriction endonuclease McrA
VFRMSQKEKLKMADSLLYPRLFPEKIRTRKIIKKIYTWKEETFLKLGRVCNRCGIKSNLTIHHKNHNHNDCRIENLEILCRDCHNKHHRIKDSKQK